MKKKKDHRGKLAQQATTRCHVDAVKLRMMLDLQSHTQSHTKTSKPLRHGTKVKSLVPGMGRQVGTKVTCNEGKGMRKRETFRMSQAEGNSASGPRSQL